MLLRKFVKFCRCVSELASNKQYPELICYALQSIELRPCYEKVCSGILMKFTRRDERSIKDMIDVDTASSTTPYDSLGMLCCIEDVVGT